MFHTRFQCHVYLLSLYGFRVNTKLNVGISLSMVKQTGMCSHGNGTQSIIPSSIMVASLALILMHVLNDSQLLAH